MDNDEDKDKDKDKVQEVQPGEKIRIMTKKTIMILRKKDFKCEAV